MSNGHCFVTYVQSIVLFEVAFFLFCARVCCLPDVVFLTGLILHFAVECIITLFMLTVLV